MVYKRKNNPILPYYSKNVSKLVGLKYAPTQTLNSSVSRSQVGKGIESERESTTNIPKLIDIKELDALGAKMIEDKVTFDGNFECANIE